jgi:predicted nuclease with TOPRIM domain
VLINLETQMSETRKQDLENVKASLRALRDQIKLTAHLATMDMKDEWARLEPQLQEAEKYVDVMSKATLEGARALQNTAQKLRDRLHALHDQHDLRAH